MALDELRERVFEANRRIVEAGLVVLTFGNASAVDRAGGLMAIKPSGVPYDELGPGSMVVVDLESGDVREGSARPSSDTPTHLVLYRAFEEIGGIVHTHSPFATAWAQARREILCFGTTHADHFRGAVPVTRELTREEKILLLGGKPTTGRRAFRELTVDLWAGQKVVLEVLRGETRRRVELTVAPRR